MITQLIGAHTPPALMQAVGVDILARMLLSLLVEAAQIIASSEGKEDAAGRVQLVLNKVVQALSA